MDEMKDPITLDFTATQAPAEDAPVGQKALDSERPPVRVVLLALDQGKFDSQRSLDELAALEGILPGLVPAAGEGQGHGVVQGAAVVAGKGAGVRRLLEQGQEV